MAALLPWPATMHLPLAVPPARHPAAGPTSAGRSGRRRLWLLLLLTALAAAGVAAAAPASAPAMPSPALAAAGSAGWALAPAAPTPCRLEGLAQAARCGVLRRPLDPARPQGAQVDIHYAVLPALARRKAEDPVVFFAGGPGQSAIDLAGPLAGLYARLAQRRDLVFIDQRGTGRSAPLRCPNDEPAFGLRPLAEQTDAALRLARLRSCLATLQALPHGDLRFFTTALAMDDVDAVRTQLGAPRINAIGASYGTRAVLAYLHQHPQRVRRAVLDGVAPPDMRLTESVSADNQAAMDALIEACATEPACAQRHPQMRAQWQQLLAQLPQTVSLPHPLSGQAQRVTLTRDTVLGLVRAPLYQPALAAGLPAAVAEAAQGRWAPLAALAGSLGGSRAGALATGMHLSVVCAEDMSSPADASLPAAADFGDSFQRYYQQACAFWPRGTTPAGFRQVPPSPAPVWLLSGGLDPVTPPRHGQRMAAALGPQARHTVVPAAGHGVASLPCLREAVQRFISTEGDAEALAIAQAADCAQAMPRPPAFAPPGLAAASAAASGGAR